MSIFRLKVFRSVAVNKSFTKASQKLFITQPAVSKHIRELETDYKTRLFERNGSSVELTDSGRLLMEYSEKILKDYGRLEYEMNLLNNRHKGTLRLGASTTIAQYVLPLYLARFIDKFPEVKVSLLNGNSEEVEKALLENRIDLALVEGNIRQANLKYSLFLKDELVAIVHTGSRLKNLEEIPLSALCRTPLVLREEGSGTLDVLLSALEEHHIRFHDLNVLMQLGSTESIKRFLKHSDAMGIVSIRSVMDEVAAGQFRIVDVQGLEMNREFDFVQQQGDEGAISAVFMEFLNYYKDKL